MMDKILENKKKQKQKRKGIQTKTEGIEQQGIVCGHCIQ